jgi:hypothetical protein
MSRISMKSATSRLGVAALCVAAFAATVVFHGSTAHAGGTTVTYGASVTLPAQPSSNFSGAAGGGDGWGVALTTTQLFNVFHHSSTLQVNCHNQSNASNCWAAPKTITDGASHTFAVSGQPGMTIDPTTKHLFVWGTRTSDNTGGVVCVDTTKPAGDLNPFCGFTALTGVGEASNPGLSNISNPVTVGTNWYAFNYFNGVPTGTEDTLLCFNLKTRSACAKPSIPVALGLTAGAAIANGTFPEPSIADVNGRILIPTGISGGSGPTSTIGCFDPATSKKCAGSWPISLAFSYASANGSAFPYLTATGSVKGFCLPTANDVALSGKDPCYGMGGGAIAAPSHLTTAIPANDPWNGTSIVLGSRIYVPNGNTNEVHCFDFAKNASCPHFAKSFVNLGYLYTVNADPQRPTCIWVNADDGTEQIQNFDAYSGGSCATSPYRVFTSQIVAAPHACIPAQYSSFTVKAPSSTKYKSGTVDFETSNGTPIPGIKTHHLSKGTTSLTDLHLSTNHALPQFLLTLVNPPSTLKSVTIRVEWSGKYLPQCVVASTGVKGAGPPGPPIDVAGHVTHGNADVTWKPPTSDGHSPITGYRITAIGPTGAAVGKCSTVAPVLTCNIGHGYDLTQIYQFNVVAVNAVGHSTPGVGYSAPLVPEATTSPITSAKVKVTG